MAVQAEDGYARGKQEPLEGDRLYERYAKPLEAEHEGKYVAVSKDGQTLLRDDLTETVYAGAHTFGAGSYVFKLGARVVGPWR